MSTALGMRAVTGLEHGGLHKSLHSSDFSFFFLRQGLMVA